MSRVHESLLPWKSNKYYLLVCVRACVRALGTRVRGRVHAHTMHVALLIQHETRMRHIVTSFVAPTSPQNFSTLSHKRCDFRKKEKGYGT